MLLSQVNVDAYDFLCKAAPRGRAFGDAGTLSRHLGPFDELAPLFRKAQRLIERRYFRDRKSLMYHEKERKKILIQMGQDPYLDSPS